MCYRLRLIDSNLSVAKATNRSKHYTKPLAQLGQILAGSNYTDDEGNIEMGVNARIGIVPYKGYSMDDAIVISQLFPTKFTKEQLELLDDDGIVKPGTVLKKGDPIMLATKPKAVNSAEHLGKLGRMIGQLRNDAAEGW